MAKILTFPERQPDTLPSQYFEKASDFLVFDSGGTLCFSKADEDSSSPTALAPRAPKDWSNQELASIYRVKHLLDAAQIPTVLDRGVSDEGDPWCVFCTPEGDVFIHLSRIDGLYWLDSPKLPSPLNGFSFDELVQGFIKLSDEGKRDAENATPKIVRFKRSNTVFLHPSVMLAALVWSLYFDADELLVPSIRKDDERSPEQGEPKSWFLNLDEDVSHSDVKSLPEKAGDKVLLQEVSGQDTYNKAAVGAHLPFSMALGLGSIAVACGLIMESDWKGVLRSLFSSDVNQDLQSGSSSVDETSSSVTSVLLQSLELIASFVVGADDEAIADTTDLDPDSAVVGSVSDNVIGNLAELVAALEEAMGSAAEETPQKVAKAESSELVEGLEEYKVLTASIDPTAELDITKGGLEGGSQSDTLVELLDFFFGGSSLSTINKDGTVYLVDISNGEFDLKNLEIVEQAIFEAGNDHISVPSVQDSSGFQSSANEPWDAAAVLPLFDQNARDLISELWDNSNSLSFALTGKDLVLFDLSVSRSNEEQAQMTWVTEDGGTVTLLGAKADFEEFGYV